MTNPSTEHFETLLNNLAAHFGESRNATSLHYESEFTDLPEYVAIESLEGRLKVDFLIYLHESIMSEAEETGRRNHRHVMLYTCLMNSEIAFEPQDLLQLFDLYHAAHSRAKKAGVILLNFYGWPLKQTLEHLENSLEKHQLDQEAALKIEEITSWKEFYFISYFKIYLEEMLIKFDAILQHHSSSRGYYRNDITHDTEFENTINQIRRIDQSDDLDTMLPEMDVGVIEDFMEGDDIVDQLSFLVDESFDWEYDDHETIVISHNRRKYIIPLKENRHDIFIALSSIAEIFKDTHDIWIMPQTLKMEYILFHVFTKQQTQYLYNKHLNMIPYTLQPLRLGYDYICEINVPYLNHENNNPDFEIQARECEDFERYISPRYEYSAETVLAEPEKVEKKESLITAHLLRSRPENIEALKNLPQSTTFDLHKDSQDRYYAISIYNGESQSEEPFSIKPQLNVQDGSLPSQTLGKLHEKLKTLQLGEYFNQDLVLLNLETSRLLQQPVLSIMSHYHKKQHKNLHDFTVTSDNGYLQRLRFIAGAFEIIWENSEDPTDISLQINSTFGEETEIHKIVKNESEHFLDTTDTILGLGTLEGELTVEKVEQVQ